jgi:predicted enzyme related to lactoylglutathione lyase
VPSPYPHEFWLAFNVADVDATCHQVTAAGGSIVRPGEDQPDHGVRAAVVADPEGHIIEIVGPVAGAGGPVADPLAAGQRVGPA